MNVGDYNLQSETYHRKNNKKRILIAAGVLVVLLLIVGVVLAIVLTRKHNDDNSSTTVATTSTGPQKINDILTIAYNIGYKIGSEDAINSVSLTYFIEHILTFDF